MTAAPSISVKKLKKEAKAALQRGAIAEAQAIFETIFEAKPDHPAGLVGLARCAQLSSDWSRAADFWKAARDASTQEEWRLRWQGKYVNNLVRAGRREEARREIEASWDTTQQRRDYWAATRNVADGTHEQVRFDHVLIVTYGRSGSTILQGVLNSINGLLVRGENGNVFYDFFKTTRELEQHSLRSANTLVSNSPWFGISEMSPEFVLRELRPTARRMLLGDEVDNPGITSIGFKEIRYLDVKDDLFDYLDFLGRLFPNAAFIFNTRDLGETTKSGWWAEQDAGEVGVEIRQLETLFAEFAAGRSNCFEISYRNVVSKDGKLKELFEFLGAEFDEQRVDAVLAVSHSYAPNLSHGTDLEEGSDPEQEGEATPDRWLG